LFIYEEDLMNDYVLVIRRAHGGQWSWSAFPVFKKSCGYPGIYNQRPYPTHEEAFAAAVAWVKENVPPVIS
jgi:hypothetical protein